MTISDEQRDWLCLSLVPGVGTTSFIRLLARFRTPRAVLNAAEGALADVVGRSLAQRIARYSESVDVDGQLRRMGEYDASLVTMEDPLYPQRLAEIYDPPLLLFVRGELREQDTHSIAMVGTRRATPYGIRTAEHLARDLASRGITVVSGMANGIDAAAHRGAIEAGGRTIAVLGCGVDIVYPAQNGELMNAIIEHGAVVSQFAMGMKPSKGHFPYRNRIISGMTLGTVIVEAPERSGALITARQAAEQGREVFAVPGNVGVNNSRGPHALIREGAKLTETVEDILVELELPAHVRGQATTSPAEIPRNAERTSAEPAPASPQQASKPPEPVMSEAEKDILAVLSTEGSFVDEIAMTCRISVSETLSLLTMLELKGLVRQFSGKRFAPR